MIALTLTELQHINEWDHSPRRWEEQPKSDLDKFLDRVIYTTVRTVVDQVAPIIESTVKHWNESKEYYK